MTLGRRTFGFFQLLLGRIPVAGLDGDEGLVEGHFEAVVRRDGSVLQLVALASAGVGRQQIGLQLHQIVSLDAMDQQRMEPQEILDRVNGRTSWATDSRCS